VVLEPSYGGKSTGPRFESWRGYHFFRLLFEGDSVNEEEKTRIVRDGYDKIASLYHADRLSFDISDMLRTFMETVQSEGHILDAGCGAGVPVAKTLADNGFQVTGIDISEGMLRLARKHVPKARFLQQDMTKLSFNDCLFDGIISTFAIIHVPKVLHGDVFHHFYRILKPGGTLFVSVGVNEWEDTHEFYGAQMFWSHFEKDTSCELVSKVGFGILWQSVVETRDEQHYWILAKKG